MRKLTVLAAMLFCSTAYALGGTNFSPNNLGINGAVLKNNPSFTISSQDFTSLTVYINLTQVSATAVTLNCAAGNEAVYAASIGVASVASSGVITMADASWTYPTNNQSRVFRIIVGPIADKTLSCTIGGQGATTDTVKVAAYGVH